MIENVINLSDITMFKDYPDVITVSQLEEMLKISRKLAYRLLTENNFKYRKIGREYRITKASVVNYILKGSVA